MAYGCMCPAARPPPCPAADLDGDAAQQLAGEDAQQRPGQVQRVKDGAVLVRALTGGRDTAEGGSGEVAGGGVAAGTASGCGALRCWGNARSVCPRGTCAKMWGGALGQQRGRTEPELQ